jgi:hypothetical protein
MFDSENYYLRTAKILTNYYNKTTNSKWLLYRTYEIAEVY